MAFSLFWHHSLSIHHHYKH
jgi:DNA mismatch repair ATPase MutL